MPDIERRLLACFSSAFPDLPESQLSSVSQASHSEWDSVAHVTLIALLSEEFAIELSPDEIEEVTSFAKMLAVVTGHVSGA